ncbi:MAG: DNA-3-methyladenine glycosylase [Candidatus Caldarchaeum sp.]|nr:DNA-3-methyladenine glycosylase [Candidatus Caldarchaeum sp.]
MRLGRGFYDCNTVELAKKLLGKVIVFSSGSKVKKCRIVETEAYVKNDRANHAFKGMTKRNRSMFGPAGPVKVF